MTKPTDTPPKDTGTDRGNTLFPLSPKAIRLLRAHDRLVAQTSAVPTGTGEDQKARA